MNLISKLQKIHKAKLIEYTVEESFKIFKQYAKLGFQSAFLDFDNIKKADKLAKALRKHGFKCVFCAGGAFVYLDVFWNISQTDTDKENLK